MVAALDPNWVSSLAARLFLKVLLVGGGGKPSRRARGPGLHHGLFLGPALGTGCRHYAASSYLRGVAAASRFNCDVLLISF